MEAVSVSDPSQQSEETEALLKKVDYDPYNEDEVNLIEKRKAFKTIDLSVFCSFLGHYLG